MRVGLFAAAAGMALATAAFAQQAPASMTGFTAASAQAQRAREAQFDDVVVLPGFDEAHSGLRWQGGSVARRPAACGGRHA